MSLVRIGRLGRPHGLAGEVTLDGASLSARELMQVKTFEWKGREASRGLELMAARDAVPRPLLRFEGFRTRADAATLTNGELWADRERLPDPGPGVVWTFQLIGCRVVTEEGRELGTLEAVWNTGAHPIYVVRGEREWLLPAHAEVVRHVDLEAGTITVRPPAGIEDI